MWLRRFVLPVRNKCGINTNLSIQADWSCEDWPGQSECAWMEMILRSEWSIEDTRRKRRVIPLRSLRIWQDRVAIPLE